MTFSAWLCEMKVPALKLVIGFMVLGQSLVPVLIISVWLCLPAQVSRSNEVPACGVDPIRYNGKTCPTKAGLNSLPESALIFKDIEQGEDVRLGDEQAEQPKPAHFNPVLF